MQIDTDNSATCGEIETFHDSEALGRRLLGGPIEMYEHSFHAHEEHGHTHGHGYEHEHEHEHAHEHEDEVRF